LVLARWRVTGRRHLGWPRIDKKAKVLKRAVELAEFDDTADAYGPDTSELLIAEALYPYPKGSDRDEGGLTRPAPSMGAKLRPDHLKQATG